MLHPKDLEFIRNIISNCSVEMLESLKNLQPGTAIAFGTAFQIPISLRFEKPNPEPLSNNANLIKLWY